MSDEGANMGQIRSYFEGELRRIDYEGLIGVAAFASVHDELMPVQGQRLMEVCGDNSLNLIENGSIICIGMAYPEHAIDSINVVVDGVVDKDRWNLYAGEYKKINGHLNDISEKIARRYGGIAIAATLGGLVGKVENVSDYYPLTISHRAVAENAGLGWRGKNELIVNERYGCAMRFASIITALPLPHGRKIDTKCGSCMACLNACPILKGKEKLSDFRESCRRFIKSLTLSDEVCGKCIKSCYRQSIFKGSFKLRD